MENIVKHIKMMPVSLLKPYEKNARTHSDEQVKQIAASITEFGFTNPILIDGESGIIAGHGRLEAAKLLGISEVPTIELTYLTPEQRRAYIIADNKLALNAGWDLNLLAEELEAIAADGFDLGLVGFSQDELDELLLDEEETKSAGDEEAAPGVQENPVARKGDIWLLGKHRLMCGDSTMIDDVEKLMANTKAAMMFTDPPWNVAIGQDNNPRHRQREGLQNDDMSSEEFQEFLQGFIACYMDWFDGDMYCVLGASEWPNLDLALREYGYHWSATIIWVKDQFVLGRSKYHRRYEPIWYGWNKKNKSSFGERRDLDDVWEIPRPKRSAEHPTMKPVALAERAIENSSAKNDVVVDPFGGAGSTLIACEKTNRICYTMELAEKYCDVIIRRWQEYTGKSAILESNGKTYDQIKVMYHLGAPQEHDG